MPLEKTYQPQRLETRWYSFWEERGFFAPSRPDAPPFCVMIPPPNVTGRLHMGHGFTTTVQDTLIRYHRMRGANTLWQPGTDHAGIATQMVVERALAASGKTRHDFGREKFIDKIWEWKAKYGGSIADQFRRLGASADWQNERFTMDAQLSAAVHEVFERLYDEGLIYRGKRLVNWDPHLLTAVSDLEVVSEEEDGVMYYARYPFVDEKDAKDKKYDGGVVIGTTRPETILVDGAIAVHPEDKRFQAIVGKRVWVPMTEPPRAIEIIADSYVQPEFGSGCVKITAAHDFNDYAVYQRHPDKNIPLLNLLTANAKLNHNAPKKYQGLDRYEARKQIVADLRAQKLLVKETPHRYTLPRGDRSGAVLEPMLTDQWYVDLTRDKQSDGRRGGKSRITTPAIEAVQSGRVKFVPGNWSKTYYQWLENIEDWCISRQIWWGHRIPAWYDEEGKIFVGKDEDAVRAKYSLPPAQEYPLRQDEDVLDTWFSSALWPFSTLGWPQETERLKTFYPTSVLVTGFDIIFFWVARMIMMGEAFMEKEPFDTVYIHGLVRDAHGNKMSKSKGNVLDPIDLIDGIDLDALVESRTRDLMRPKDKEKIAAQTRRDFPKGIPAFGADALRFTFAALASTGRDINFDLARTVGYRNFCNKIWNAAHFVLMNCEGKDCGVGAKKGAMQFSPADLWMRETLREGARAVNDAMQKYRLDLVAKELHELVWKHFCDWYVEACKVVLNDAQSSGEQLRGTRHTLANALETLLRLAHPIMPFITEELWQAVAPLAGKAGDTIMTQAYPDADSVFNVKESAGEVAQMRRVIEIVQTIRNLRGENRISPAKRVPIFIVEVSEGKGKKSVPPALQLSEVAQRYIAVLARTESIGLLSANAQELPAGARALSPTAQAQIILPLENLRDAKSEVQRAEKELQAVGKRIAMLQEKLANPQFVKKAPAAVVEKERARLKELQEQEAQLAQVKRDLKEA